MILPHAKDCEQIEYYVSDFLALANGLALAYPDPGFRRYMEPDRQELLEACRRLMDVLAAPERAEFRQLAARWRESIRASALLEGLARHGGAFTPHKERALVQGERPFSLDIVARVHSR